MKDRDRDRLIYFRKLARRAVLERERERKRAARLEAELDRARREADDWRQYAKKLEDHHGVSINSLANASQTNPENTTPQAD